MSRQEDCNLLFMMAIERYSKDHTMTTDSVIQLFEQRQIFSRILANHEYLHQLDFERTMEAVEKWVRNEDRITIFHGTTSKFSAIDLSVSRNKLDFGKGFYTTTLRQQAHEWAIRKARYEECDTFFVYQYAFAKKDDVKIKIFENCSEEWLDMIVRCRTSPVIAHDYDIVFGPVADDSTMHTIQSYINGSISKTNALQKLTYAKVNNQMSFHTDKAVKCLMFLERDMYDTNSDRILQNT